MRHTTSNDGYSQVILYINLIKWLHWHFWWHFKKISNFKKKKKIFFLVGIDDGKFIVLTDNEGKLNKYLFCTTILKLDLQKIINCYRFVYLLFWCLWQAAKWRKERKKRKITSIQRHEKWNECITLLSTSSIPTSQLWLLSCNSIFHLLTSFFRVFFDCVRCFVCRLFILLDIFSFNRLDYSGGTVDSVFFSYVLLQTAVPNKHGPNGKEFRNRKKNISQVHRMCLVHVIGTFEYVFSSVCSSYSSSLFFSFFLFFFFFVALLLFLQQHE